MAVEDQKERRKAHREAGLCHDCATLALPGLTRCAKHHEAVKRYAARTYRKRLTLGLCPHCRTPNSTGTAKCESCLQKQSDSKTAKSGRKLMSKRNPHRQQFWLNRIRYNEPLLRLNWEAVLPFIRQNIALWSTESTTDTALWDHLPLTHKDGKEPSWTPAQPYYDKLGSVISFEDYCIDMIDRQQEQIRRWI